MNKTMLTREQKAHVEKWLDILEHGMYEQAGGFLKQLRRGLPYYCCLGVAAEAVCGRQLRGENTHPPKVFGYDTKLRDGSLNFTTMNLGPEDADILGLNIAIEIHEMDKLVQLTGLSRGRVFGTRQDVCIQMNDEANLTFEEIANVFREMEWNV